MPNNIKNLLILDENQNYDRFLKKCDEYYYFDFNQFKPQPDEIKEQEQYDLSVQVEKVARASLGFSRWQAKDLINKLNDREFEYYIKMLRCYRKCNFLTWRDWNIYHWGTKWNSYNVVCLNKHEILFDTAWSPPHPVISKMAEKIEGKLTHIWSDEDIPFNVGRIVYERGGYKTFHEDLSESKEGYEIAFKLRPHRKEEYLWCSKLNNYKIR